MSNFPEMEYQPIPSDEAIELGAGETSVDLLRRVYRNPRLPLNTRLRAAIEAAPYEHSRYPTRITVNDDFATKLDRAIAASNLEIEREIERRSNRARVVNAQVIEHRPQGEGNGQ